VKIRIPRVCKIASTVASNINPRFFVHSDWLAMSCASGSRGERCSSIWDCGSWHEDRCYDISSRLLDVRCRADFVKDLVAFKCVMAERQRPRQHEKNFTGLSMTSVPVTESRIRVHRHGRALSIIA